MIHFWATFFDTFFANFRKMKKFDEIGQIRSDWAHIENPDSRDRVLDSAGGFGQFFRKIGGKMKIRFFRGEKKIFESIAKSQRPPRQRNAAAST